MENNNNQRNSKKRFVIAAGLSAFALVIAVVAIAQYSNAQGTNSQAIISDGSQQEQFRLPPPRELSMWGTEISSFEQAKTATGIPSTFASLPGTVPTGLEIASIRTNTSPGGSYLSVFYTPAGVTAKDSDTFEKVMSSGGMLIVYSQEQMGPKYNQTKFILSFVNEAPTVRHVSTISGLKDATTILVDGNQTRQIPSEVIVIYDQAAAGTKTMTDLVSLKYDSMQLAKVVESLSR
ncbi:MAG TPA: hypothetical protein VHA09_02665 [Nitrososphaera sp.]|nr:hypothetical protein [Nitrososphaera sp.]